MVARTAARRILSEDSPIFPALQRGVEASTFPGVIGTREERVYTFQEFLVNRCGTPEDSNGKVTR